MAARSQTSARLVSGGGVNGELAVVRNRLDHKDPDACAAKPATNRADEANVVAGIAIILRQQLGPARP